MRDAFVLRDARGVEHRAAVGADGTVTVGGTPVSIAAAPDGSLYTRGTANLTIWAVVSEGTRWVFVGGQVFTFEIERGTSVRRSRTHHGTLTAPMPATVRSVAVKPGDAVKQGDVLVVLEAMKMELPIRAGADGTVRAVHCRAGEMVRPDQELIEVS